MHVDQHFEGFAADHVQGDAPLAMDLDALEAVVVGVGSFDASFVVVHDLFSHERHGRERRGHAQATQEHEHEQQT